MPVRRGGGGPEAGFVSGVCIGEWAKVAFSGLDAGGFEDAAKPFI